MPLNRPQTGTLLIPHLTTPMQTWAALLLLLTLHLFLNRAAVRSVRLRSLNRQRANLVFSHLIAHGQVLSPHAVAQRERIFERDGVLRWCDDAVLGWGCIGGGAERLVSAVRMAVGVDGNEKRSSEAMALARLAQVFDGEGYLLWVTPAGGTTGRSTGKSTVDVVIVVKKGAAAAALLRAWCQGLLAARWITAGSRKDHGDAVKQPQQQDELQRGFLLDHEDAVGARLRLLADSLSETRRLFARWEHALCEAGWDLSTDALETKGGRRVAVRSVE